MLAWVVIYLRVYLEKYIDEILVVHFGRADALRVDPFSSEAYLFPGTFIVCKDELYERFKTLISIGKKVR